MQQDAMVDLIPLHYLATLVLHQSNDGTNLISQQIHNLLAIFSMRTPGEDCMRSNIDTSPHTSKDL